MFVVHDTLLNQRKMKKNTMFIYNISFFSLKVMVFSQKKVYYAFIAIKRVSY